MSPTPPRTFGRGSGTCKQMQRLVAFSFKTSPFQLQVARRSTVVNSSLDIIYYPGEYARINTQKPAIRYATRQDTKASQLEKKTLQKRRPPRTFPWRISGILIYRGGYRACGPKIRVSIYIHILTLTQTFLPFVSPLSF